MTPDYNDNEKERQLLYRSLTKASGFHLYLVQCNNPGLRAEVLAFLEERLGSVGITLYHHHLKKPVVSLDDFFPPGVRFREGEKAVLAVSGLENSFSPAGEPQAFLHRLNFARDVMPKKFPVPFVLWLPVGAFKKILTEAHDVWSWRSGTFYFSTPPEMIRSQLEEIAALKEKEGGGTLSEKAYKERSILFSDLLEDLKLQPESQKNQLQRADVMAQIAELHYSFSDNVSRPDQKKEYLEKSLEFQLKASRIYEQVFDKNHPDLASSYNNLSLIYRVLGQPEKALEFQLKALHIREQLFEKNHPDLANSYNNLAVIYMALKDYDSAAVYGEKALVILQRLFPNGHPNLDMVKRNLEGIKKAVG